MGTVVEDIVAPSVRRLAREVFECGSLQSFGTRVSVTRSDDRSREREFDALYVGTQAVLLNQTKSSPRIDDVREFVEFLQSNQFALYFPQYREVPVLPAFSSSDTARDIRPGDGRRGDAGAQPGRGTPAAHRNVSQIAQEAPLNLGSALLKRNRLEEALAACHVAEEQRP